MRVKPSAIALSTLLLLLPAPMATATSGELTFSLLPGWSISNSEGDSTRIVHKSEKGNVSMIFFATAPLQGSVTESFRQRLQSGFPNSGLRLERMREGQSVYGHAAATVDERIRDPKSGKRLRMTGVAYAVNGRMQVAVLVTPNGAESDDRKHELEEMARTGDIVSRASPLRASLTKLAAELLPEP